MGKIYEALMKSETSDTYDTSKAHSNSMLNGILSNDGDSYEKLVVINNPGSLIAENFRFLRSKILNAQHEFNMKTLLITSSEKGEGKSFVAANLAACIAKGLDEYVLLVDGDLRQPQLHNIFEMDNHYGLSDHVQQDIDLKNVIQHTGIEKLSLITAGSQIGAPVETLSSSKMKSFIQEVRNRYSDRYVIFDSPPLNIAPESLVLARLVDSILYIILKGKTSRKYARLGFEKLPSKKVFGAVLNGHKEKKRKYRYKSYYHGGYEKSYT